MCPYNAVLPAAVVHESLTLSKQERADALKAEAVSGSSPAGSAFAAFSALTTACGTAQHAINVVSFGPYPISGSCSHDCHFKEFKWRWKPDFNGCARFSSALSNMNIASVFSNAFNPAEAFVAALPTATAGLTKAIDHILTIDIAIRNAGGKATPAQDKALTDAFAAALSVVQNSLAACNGALQNMSSIPSRQQSKNGYLQDYSDQVQSRIDGCVTSNMNDLIGKAPCGSGDITNKFNGIKAKVSNSIAALTTPFANVNAAFVTAIQAASSVAGTLLAVQSQYASVSGPINEARGLAPVSPVRMIKLDVAKKAWAQFVAYTQANLST
jgi:hypothetical protein